MTPKQTSRPDILILGDQGQVGHELKRALRECSSRLVLGSESTQGQKWKPGQVSDLLNDIRPRLILNAAAYTAVDQAEEEEQAAFEMNADLPGKLAEGAREIGAALIHYSTDHVYDGTRTSPYTEESPTHPVNVYGKSKLEGDQRIQESGSTHLIFRTSWVYGGRGRNFFLTLQRLAQERDEIRVVNDQTGAPTWCRTIAETTVQVLRKTLGETLEGEIDSLIPLSGIYHLTCSGETSWYGFAQAIVDHMKLSKPPRVVPISTAEYPTPAPRPANSCLNNDKLQQTFRVPPVSWQEALAHCVESGSQG